jgi:hypothetical protein
MTNLRRPRLIMLKVNFGSYKTTSLNVSKSMLPSTKLTFA